MSKRWDEAVEAAGRAIAADEQEDYMESWVRYDRQAAAAITAFALSAHGQTGPAALRDWVEGRAVLVDRRIGALLASPAASDGETK